MMAMMLYSLSLAVDSVAFEDVIFVSLHGLDPVVHDPKRFAKNYDAGRKTFQSVVCSLS